MVELNKHITITDSELFATNIPPVNFVIQDLLPASGLAVIGGKPKMGKSLIMIDLGLAISSGGRFLNVFDVKASEVLYLALEDTDRRMKARIKKMIPDCPPSGRLHLAFSWDNQGHEAMSSLGSWLDAHQNVKIVIIDTISRFSPSFSGVKYSDQYVNFAELKKFADTRNIIVMIVHHLKKTKSNDPFEMLYGSNAVAGAADTIWILQRERGEPFATLQVSGRDIPDQFLSMKIDESLLCWTVIDPMTEKLIKREFLKVYNILKTKGSVMSLTEISIASGFKKPVLSKYLHKLIEYEYVEKVGYGRYRIKNRRENERKEDKYASRSCPKLIQ